MGSSPSISVPRAIDVTGSKSRDDLAADREWQQIAARRRDLAAALKQAQRQPGRHHQSAANIRRNSWKRIASETRSA